MLYVSIVVYNSTVCIVCVFLLAFYSNFVSKQCDRRTDGHTDRQTVTTITVFSRADERYKLTDGLFFRLTSQCLTFLCFTRHALTNIMLSVRLYVRL